MNIQTHIDSNYVVSIKPNLKGLFYQFQNMDVVHQICTKDKGSSFNSRTIHKKIFHIPRNSWQQLLSFINLGEKEVYFIYEPMNSLSSSLNVPVDTKLLMI